MAADPAFDSVPVGSTFFLIWRVKDFALVPVPKEDYGTFFKGDSYVVICCAETRNSGHSQMENKPLKSEQTGFIDIHFWIGSNSSQDEAGVAAIKTVELDDFLGGTPVQHREVEGHESKQFLSYFRNGIRLMKGGFESGFHKVDDRLEPSLYQVKGKKRPIMHELNEISWSSMNDGDVFILVVPGFIFVWGGQKANHMERLVAIRIANDLKYELSRFHLSVVVVEDGQENELSSAEHQAFNSLLSLKEKDKLHSSTEFDFAAASDEQYESSQQRLVHLYRCKEADDNIVIQSVKDGPLTSADLDSNDTFIVDNGPNGLWVWVGKDATKKERSSALKYALELIKTKNYPAKTEVTKVIEEGETVEFKSLFKTWANQPNQDKHARLFHLLRNGHFAQVGQYEQNDLEEDNVMILDAGDRIYVWVGSKLQDKLSDESTLGKIAQYYLKHDSSGRNIGSEHIVFVKQGNEDSQFKSYFKHWK